MNHDKPEDLMAVYKKQLVKQYDGNILIEALPEIMDFKQIARALTSKPVFSTDEKQLPEHIRAASLSRIFSYFQPLSIHVEYADKIGRMIRDGYISRRPKPVREQLTPEELAEHTKSVRDSDVFDCVASAGVLGMSGMGKTTTTNKILSMYPQQIIHGRPYNLTQVVWVKIDCPSKGSMKKLCTSFFQAIDDILETEYARLYYKLSIDDLLAKMADVAARHYVGLFVIDEIQHLVKAKGTGDRAMLNFLVTMNNVVKVPVLLIGTPTAKVLLQKEFRQARRMDGIGGIYWKRLGKGDYWDFFIKGLWKYNWLKNDVPLTQELSDVLYEESQGIIDVVLKIFLAAQYRAILDESETITPELIRFAAQHDIPNMRETIDAIKANPAMAEKAHGDVTAATMEDIVSSVRNSMPSKIQSDDESGQTSILGRAVSTLMSMDIPETYAVREVSDLLKKSPDMAMKNIVGKVIESYDKLMKFQNQPKRKEDKPELLKIRDTAEAKGLPVYDALKEHGLIKNPSEDFELGAKD